MAEAFLWGLAGGVSLVLGALLVFVTTVGRRTLGVVMAFGAGVLISAVSFELVQEAVESTDGDWSVAIGLFSGAIVFFAGDTLIDRMGGQHRKNVEPPAAESNSKAILLGTILDGVPENVVIGLSLVRGAGVNAAVVVAVFLSNLPESIASTTGLLSGGWSKRGLLLMWGSVALVAGLSSLAGYAVFDQAPDELVAAMMAFAAGALLTMLADTMMPQAFVLEGKLAGLFTTTGFAVGFAAAAI
ncbi:MAG: hypothetical protein WAO61_04745 [Solirubrobacterales bacterium]